MNPEQRKNHRGGARVQKPERPRREKETKREKKPGRPRTKKQKILLGLYIALTVVAAIIVAGAIVFSVMSAPPEVALPTPTPRHTTIINEQGEEVEVEIPGLSAGRKEQFYTFLVTGISGGNTDTMLLAAYDVPNQTLNVMSIPRDTYVRYNGRTVMINSVYSRAGGKDGGVEALKKAVGTLTGVTPDFYVLVEWEAVGELVDAIGGVYFDVPRRMYYNDLSQHFKIDLQPGYQLLDGNGAMGVLRWRHNSDDSGHILNSGYAMGDLGRIETQQAFLKEVVRKCLQPDVLLSNLMDYISIFQKNVTTDLSVGNLAYFGKSAIGKLDMDSVEFVTLPNKPAGSHLLPNGGAIVAMVNEGFNPYLDEITIGDLTLATKDPNASSTKPLATPAHTPEATVTPSPTPSGEMPVVTPPATSTPGGSQPPAISTPGGQTPPPVQTPAATPTPAVPSAEPTPPPAENTPAMTPPPAATPDGGYGPGMVPVE